jgi:hypothetical protein
MHQSHDVDEQAQVLLHKAREARNGRPKSERWPPDRRDGPHDVPRDPTAPHSHSINDCYYDPGKAEQAAADAGHRWAGLAEERALPAIGEHNEGIEAIRASAEVQEALNDLAREEEVVQTTLDRVDERTLEGAAAAAEAARHQAQLPGLQAAAQQAQDELDEHLDLVQSPPPPHGTGKPAPEPVATTTLEQPWLTRHLRWLFPLVVLDLLAIALGLEPRISATIPMSFVGQSLLLALAVGGVLEVAGMLSGVLVSRLFGQRSASALLLLALIGVAALLFHHVELVRDGVDSSIFLSDVSALAMIGAAVLAYITAVNLAADHRRRQLAAHRTALYGWMDERTARLTQRAEGARRAYLERLELVERLERMAEQAPALVAGEHRAGVAAGVRAALLPQRLRARLEAEHGHTRLRIARAESEYGRARNLEREDPRAVPPVASERRVGVGWLVGALAALAGIGAAAIAGSLVAVGLGAAVGALILLAGLLWALRRRPTVVPATGRPSGSGSLTDRLGDYVHLPRTMEPRHGSQHSTGDTI